MRWLHRERQPDVWEVADDQPLGDIGAAHKIRDICASAGTIADRLVAAGGRDAEKQQAADDSMRDVSVGQIIKLCVQVDHLKTARVLLRAIQSEKSRADLVADHPKLIDQDAAN
jgi:hypothetical protein